MAEKSVTIRIIGDAKSAQTAFNSVEVSAGKAETSLSRIGTTAAGFAIGGALTQLPGLLLDGARGATEDSAAMDGLRVAVENTGKSYDEMAPAIEDAIKRGQKLAFTDGETAEALSTLTDMTGSSDEALRRLGSAQDLARAKGISLNEAAKLLGKVSDENTTALRRLGIQVGENATAQDVLNAVDAQFQGRAGAFAESDAGKLLKAEQASGELAETFGSFLIPAMLLAAQVSQQIGVILETHVVPAVQGFIESLSGLQPILDPLVGFIQDNLTAVFVALAAMLLTVVVPAFVAWAASAATAAAATIIALAPVIAIMAAVGLAAGALYLAWDTNFLGLRDITQQVLDFVTPYFEAAMSAIRTAVEVVFPIIAQVATLYITILKTEIELALAAVQLVFNTVFPIIQGIVETVFPIIASVVSTNIDTAKVAVETGVNTIKTIFDGLVYIQGIVSDVFTTISGLVTSLWNNGAVLSVASGIGAIKSAFSGAYQAMYDAGRSLVQGLIDGVASLFGTLKSWTDKITGLLEIDVPGFSPPYDAGYKQGRSWVQGLSDGTAAGMPDFMRWASMPGSVIANSGPAPVIGTPASGAIRPAGNFANPQGGGGSSRAMSAPRSAPFLPSYIQQGNSAQGARGMLSDDFEKRIERAMERGIKAALGRPI